MQTKTICPDLLEQLLSDKIIQRFLSKVRIGSPTECWPWIKAIPRKGYGCFALRVNGKTTQFLSHRLAWIIANKSPVPDGLCVMHSCVDSKPCCNPAHLSCGTQLENIQEAVARGCRPDNRGENHGMSKLTEDQVKEVREKYSTGLYSQRDLGKIFGISQGNVGFITRKTAWVHV
jgi:hypothetical protein